MKLEQILLFLVIFYNSALNNAIILNIFPVPEKRNSGYRLIASLNCEIPCETFENNENPDAEFYIVMNDHQVQSAVDMNSKVPIRILGSQEPQHYYHLLKLEYLKHHFQGSALLDRRSDIPWLLILNVDKVKNSKVSKDALPKATFVAHNCNPMNNRNDYVKAINAKIGVLALSSCLNNAKWPDCNGTPCSKVEAIQPYKIHLAFENGDSPGFVTDKIYHALEAGVLPVWMGTRDVAETVPKGSYIDVAEFNTPDDVASYLQLVLENETLYNSYFEWKYKSFDPDYVRNNRVLWSESIFCRICYYVDTLQRGLEWDHTRQRAKSLGDNNTISETIVSDTARNISQYKPNNKQLNIIYQSQTIQYSSLIPIVAISLLINCILLILVFRRKLLTRNFLNRF